MSEKEPTPGLRVKAIRGHHKGRTGTLYDLNPMGDVEVKVEFDGDNGGHWVPVNWLAKEPT